MNGRKILAETEVEIMELLWSVENPMPSIEILNYFNDHDKNWKKQTLNTFLYRLLQAEVIDRISEHRRYLYTPIITKKQYEMRRAEDVITRIYDGSFVNFVEALAGTDVLSEKQAEAVKKAL